MKNLIQNLIAISIILPGIFAAQSCSKATGCMDKKASNYDPLAEKECASCCLYTDASSATTGNILFYSTVEAMPVITLSNGLTITAAANTGCTDARYTNHAVLEQGKYTYKATNISGMNWSGSFSITAGQCSSTGLTASNALIASNGTIQFSTDNTGLGSITVTMDDTASGIITPYIYSATFPGPGFDISAAPGIHSYTAQSANGQKWSGSIIVTSGKTAPVSFTRVNMSATATGYSNIIFYSTAEADYSIRLNNIEIGSGVIYSPNSIDVCSQKWEVSTVVPFGTYNWSSTTLSGKYFSGSVVANSNGCVTVQVM